MATEKITDKEREGVILDLARLNSHLIDLKTKYTNAKEDSEVVARKLTPYYRDKKRFDERMETKYEVSKNLEKLRDKLGDMQIYERNIHCAVARMLINYFDQYVKAYSYDGYRKLEEKLKELKKNGINIELMFDSGFSEADEFWEKFLEFVDGCELEHVYRKVTPEEIPTSRKPSRFQKDKIIITFAGSFETNNPDDYTREEYFKFSFSQRTSEEFSKVVMAIVEDIIALKREREAKKEAAEITAKENRRQLYERLKMEFEGEEK